MADSGKRSVKPKVYQSIPVTDLTGGLDLRSALTLMAPHRARRLTNWSLTQPGALVTRLGWRSYTTTTIVIE